GCSFGAAVTGAGDGAASPVAIRRGCNSISKGRSSGGLSADVDVTARVFAFGALAAARALRGLAAGSWFSDAGVGALPSKPIKLVGRDWPAVGRATASARAGALARAGPEAGGGANFGAGASLPTT